MNVTTKDMSVRLNGRTILDRIDFILSGAKTVGIIGPNGSGKSTLLKTFFKFVKPSGGSVFVNDLDLKRMSQSKVARFFSVLPQHGSADGESDFTVYEMAGMGLYAGASGTKRSREQIRESILDILDKVGIRDLSDRKMGRISGGERQMVLLARTILQDTPCLLLDEPTNHLDIYHQHAILDLISSLDKSIVIVFHDLTVASKYCDYFYLMKNGKIFTEGRPEEVLTVKNILDVYRIKPTIINHPETGKLVVLF
jgi:iron complex transport system ATP-binding protein